MVSMCGTENSRDVDLYYSESLDSICEKVSVFSVNCAWILKAFERSGSNVEWTQRKIFQGG